MNGSGTAISPLLQALGRPALPPDHTSSIPAARRGVCALHPAAAGLQAPVHSLFAR